MTTQQPDRPALVYDRPGFCPICAAEVRFTAPQAWFRDFLHCSGCRSIPRERALALVLERSFPGLAQARHPRILARRRAASRPSSAASARATWRAVLPRRAARRAGAGLPQRGSRGADLPDARFDLTVTPRRDGACEPPRRGPARDRPDAAGRAAPISSPCRPTRASSRPSGGRIFRADGSVEHMAEPEYHGNPVSDAGRARHLPLRLRFRRADLGLVGVRRRGDPLPRPPPRGDRRLHRGLSRPPRRRRLRAGSRGLRRPAPAALRNRVPALSARSVRPRSTA